MIIFRNYLTTAFRSIVRHKTVSLINISGLSLGIACAVLIFFWVGKQLDFDRSQENKQQIYRLEAVDWVCMPTIVRKPLRDFPEVRQFVQFNHWETPTISYRDNFYDIKDFVFADSSLFEIFSLLFVQGDPRTALKAPFSVVLTESTAEKMFDGENPVGKTIQYDKTFSFTVTAVIADVRDLHIPFNALARFEDLPAIKGRDGFLEEENWNYNTYLLLEPHANVPALDDKIETSLRNILSGPGEDYDFFLRPFEEIYFASGIKSEKGTRHGNKMLLILFSAIAAFILLIACINFINLTTARAAIRAKEISVRKVVGAGRRNLMGQFLIETFVITTAAQVFALILVKLFLPAFNRLMGENLTISLFAPRLMILSLVLLLFTALAAGAFPSFYLSALSPFSLLKRQGPARVKEAPFRRALIIIQFSVSIFLIAGALVVYRQLVYMQKTDLGFNQEHVVNVDLKGPLLTERKQVFKQMLLRNPGILNVAFSSQEPGNITNTNTWTVKGEEKPMKVINTDPAYVELMELELLAGRNFSWKLRSDITKTYIINEEAARFLGMESAVGERVRANFGDSEIIGIVKDFHFNSLHNSIGPLALCWYERWADIAHIKISGGNVSAIVKDIGRIWGELNPDFPFQYSFMDEAFAHQYQKEQRLSEILKIFVLLAIFLSCLGLFGLSAYMADQKTKEIGIRKVLGATPLSIMILLSKDYSRWVVSANLFAWPILYLAAHRWLQNFAYRTSIRLDIFVLSGIIAWAIALLTVSFQSLKAACTDPAGSLRYE